MLLEAVFARIKNIDNGLMSFPSSSLSNCFCPCDSFVEHDPMEILETVKLFMKETLDKVVMTHPRCEERPKGNWNYQPTRNWSPSVQCHCLDGYGWRPNFQVARSTLKIARFTFTCLPQRHQAHTRSERSCGHR